jgi:1-acyl-sn-glycerol-3-phosphate acyltransferase
MPAHVGRGRRAEEDVVALDGFMESDKLAFGGYSAALCERLLFPLDALGKRLGVELEGIERLPPGPAVLVANHAFGFWDIAFAIARIRAKTGRTVWSLGEHVWWRVPLVRRLAAAMGIVDGTPENADALLQAGELVLVLPGGVREALKPKELRYRLLWGRRYGFVRAALRNHAPLVPLACLGGDEMFDLVGNAYARGRRFHLPVPLPRPAHWLPHRTHLRFVVGEPIPARGSADDMETVKSVRHEVEGALHELLDAELAKRAGFLA